MGPLTLPTHGPVYLDANGFIYSVERVEPYRTLLEPMWRQARAGQFDVATSGWSKIAHPEKFAEKLAEVNSERDGRVVPVIKLVKAMADCFIAQEDRKLSGYHMESLAIDAFSDYQGPLDPKAMLIHLLGHSINAVKSPITDSTGQSRYVDEYLGPAESGPRKRASTYFGQMRGKVNSCKTRAAFNALFCIGD